MIHWAWLILAFYIGAATMLLFGWLGMFSFDWAMGDEKPLSIKPEPLLKPQDAKLRPSCTHCGKLYDEVTTLRREPDRESLEYLPACDCMNKQPADEAVPLSGKSPADIAGLIDRTKVPNV